MVLGTGTAKVPTPELSDGDKGEDSELVDEAQREMLDEEQAAQDGVDTSTGDALDHAKSDHDHEKVRSVKAAAIAAARELGIMMLPREETTALGLLPKATTSAL